MLWLHPQVRVEKITMPMLHVLMTVGKLAALREKDIVITGWMGPYYPDGKVHAVGYAIDFRAKFPEDEKFWKEIRAQLRALSAHYLVRFGDDTHMDHAHVGYSPHFATEFIGARN